MTYQNTITKAIAHLAELADCLDQWEDNEQAYHEEKAEFSQLSEAAANVIDRMQMLDIELVKLRVVSENISREIERISAHDSQFDKRWGV